VEKQKCGIVNREHDPAQVKVETLTQKNDFGSKAIFIRRRCGDCGEFLGDELQKIEEQKRPDFPSFDRGMSPS
jgi:hypothetical protein